jgi:hypothetical protein
MLITPDGKSVDLLKRPVDTNGLYVFKNGFDVQLTSENPADGSFENNMSDQLTLRTDRGGGKCRVSGRQM